METTTATENQVHPHDAQDDIRNRFKPLAKAEAKADEYRQKAAGALETTAGKLRTWGHESGDRATRMGDTAASNIDKVSHYLRDHSTNDLVGETRSWVTKNPGVAVAASCAMGFLLGAAMRRR